ncbi:MAG: hypothetical protein PHT91_01645 [Candidatus Nanoarchaeia archaeon]|nr:hypothetical protein [Candidatus Nanoarchaeia archaeon]
MVLQINKDYLNAITNIDKEKIKTLNMVLRENTQAVFDFFGEKTSERKHYFNEKGEKEIYAFFSGAIQGASFNLNIENYVLGNKTPDFPYAKLEKIVKENHKEMVYDFETAQSLEENLKDLRTKPEKGKIIGICTDSAKLIIEKIDEKVPKIYAFTIDAKTGNETLHAAILCFNKKGDWAVLNCKRARDAGTDYHIVPKGKIGKDEYGRIIIQNQ